MGLIEIIVTIAVVGLLVWGITTIVPMPEPFKNAIMVIAVIGLILYLLQAFGLLSTFKFIKIG